MPYLTMGYPELESALELVPALVEGGADLIELGVPFSDPLADGATIQAASQQALDNGMTLALCLEQAAALRAQGVNVPLVLMGYYNPILQMGIEPFAQQRAYGRRRRSDRARSAAGGGGRTCKMRSKRTDDRPDLSARPNLGRESAWHRSSRGRAAFSTSSRWSA